MNKYNVIELIGEGSFGRVFRGVAKDGQNPGLSLALKLVPKVGQSESDISAIRRECQIQKKLLHENIVRAIEAFETVNELVLVTEFIDGGNLASLMASHPNGMDDAIVKRLCIDLVCALHYLHGQRVLHRDLKPQNVLIEKSSGRAKLADFGFARNLGLNTFVLTSIKGTPLYMAPELIEEKPYDFKADLWSAGGILYEAAFGRPPFATNSLFQLIKKIRYEQIAWPSQGRACVPFLQGLLEKDPKKRLDWDGILGHTYLSSEPRIVDCQKAMLAFTKALTESQELAKEIQRQDKASRFPGGSQTLINIAQRYEEQKKSMQQLQQHYKGRRYSDLPHYQALLKPEPVKQRRNSDIGLVVTQTAIVDEPPFNNEEWMQFLDSQLKLLGQINANDLALLMKPFKASGASFEVIKKAVAILAMPLMSDDPEEISDAYFTAQVVPVCVQKLRQSSSCENGDTNDVIEVILPLLARLCCLRDKRLLTAIDGPFIATLMNSSNLEVQKYCLDVLIAISHHDPGALTFTNTDLLLRGMAAHAKKTIILLTLIHNKRSELKLWLKNNHLPGGCDDDKLTKLCDKLLSSF